MSSMSAAFAAKPWTASLCAPWTASTKARICSSSTSTVEQCKSAKVTVTVEGTFVTGQAQFANDAPNINGTAREDGTFGATIGWQPLTGKFSADGFEGVFRNG